MIRLAVRITALAFMLAALAPASSRAGLVLSKSPDNDGTNNVLFSESGTIGNPVYGHLNNGYGTLVEFSSTEGDLNASVSGGQAKVEMDGGGLMTNISVALADPIATFTKIVFNPYGDGLQDIGQASLTVFTNDSFNGTTFSPDDFVVGNGNNFYTLAADGLTRIKKITINITTTADETGFIDLRQVRIGGETVPAVPEPATFLLAAVAVAPSVIAGLRRRGRRAEACR